MRTGYRRSLFVSCVIALVALLHHDAHSKPVDAITVITPHTGDTLFVSQTASVSFTVSAGVTPGRSLQYTTNNGLEWKVFGSVNNATTYQWTVPNTPTQEARVRVVDDNGLSGMSGEFAILPSGVVKSVTISDAPKVPINTSETISWTSNDYLGEKADLDVSYDGVNWYPIVGDLSVTGLLSYVWKTPSFTAMNVIVRASFSSGATGYTAPFDLVAKGSVATIGSPDMRLWPNPARSEITLSGLAEQFAISDLVVFDGVGRQLVIPIERDGSRVKIDVAQIPAGVYALHAGTLTSARFVVRH